MMSEDSFSDVEEIELVDETKNQVKTTVPVHKIKPAADLPGFVDFRHAFTDKELDEDIKSQKPTPLNIDTQTAHETKMKYMLSPSSNNMDSVPKVLATGLTMHQIHRDVKNAIGLGAVEYNQKQIETIAIGDSQSTNKEDTLFRCKVTAWGDKMLTTPEQQQKLKKSTLGRLFVNPIASLKMSKFTEIQEITEADLTSVDGDEKKDGAWMRLFTHLGCIQGSAKVTDKNDTVDGETAAKNEISREQNSKKSWFKYLCCVCKNAENDISSVYVDRSHSSDKRLTDIFSEASTDANNQQISNKFGLCNRPKEDKRKFGFFRRFFTSVKLDQSTEASEAPSPKTGSSKNSSFNGHKSNTLFRRLRKRLQSKKSH